MCCVIVMLIHHLQEFPWSSACLSGGLKTPFVTELVNVRTRQVRNEIEPFPFPEA